MSDVDPADEARIWMARARSHLALARVELEGVHIEDLCFHTQQAAEFAIKAFLISRGVVYPYTHDIARLLTLVQDSGEQIPDHIEDATELTNFAAVTRYPGIASPVTHKEYEQAVSIAEDVVRWVESLMSDTGV